MTTIVYKNGLIATDSRASSGQLIVDDDFVKVKKNEHGFFAYAGTPADIDSFIAESMASREGTYEWECGALWVSNSGQLYSIDQNEKGFFYILELSLEKHYASGSGMDFALVAMDLGCTAREAVEAAARRDSGSGGTIRVYDIRTGAEVVE